MEQEQYMNLKTAVAGTNYHTVFTTSTTVYGNCFEWVIDNDSGGGDGAEIDAPAGFDFTCLDWCFLFN